MSNLTRFIHNKGKGGQEGDKAPAAATERLFPPASALKAHEPMTEPSPAPAQAQPAVVVSPPPIIIPPQAPLASSGGRPMSDRMLYANFLAIKTALDATFVNRTPMFACGDKAFTINDAVAVAIQSGTNMYLIGSRGSGKTLLAETMRYSVFGDRGLYIRGDPNLNLKELLMKINLHGKTDEEIFQVAEALKYNFALIDEINRTLGLMQNQFLNLLDRYVEIRGKKYYLGSNEYMLSVATGNPPINGEHPGVFEEDVALLDRLPFILNVDEVEHADGDIAAIMAADFEKTAYPVSDLTPDIIAANRYLRQKRHEDPDVIATVALLSEFAYKQFRYVEVSQKRIDKAQDDGWRDHLIGEHDGGKTISYVSDVSVRTLKHAARLGFAIFKIASAEAELMKSQGMPAGDVGYTEFLGSFVEALKLGLTYDRRFIPSELPKQLDKTHAEMLGDVFKDLESAIDVEAFQDAGILLTEFFDALRKGDESAARKVVDAVSKAVGENPALETAHGIMDAELRKREEDAKNAMLRAALSGTP